MRSAVARGLSLISSQEVAILFESHKAIIPPTQSQVTTVDRVPDPPESDFESTSYRFIDDTHQPESKTIAPPVLLPTRDYYKTHPLPSTEEIRRQFRRLDLTGDGKLTYLNLRSALELLQDGSDSRIDDIMIRSWLREHDHGSKGYVDMEDFLRIFESLKSQSLARSISLPKNPPVESDRINRIKRTFKKYDLNGDGLIDAEDLISVFRAAGKTVEIDEIEEWVRSRDSKGLNAVCFEDFLAHYA